MKIRIKANSIRIRLSKFEVGKLAADGALQVQTLFATGSLIYALQTTESG